MPLSLGEYRFSGIFCLLIAKSKTDISRPYAKLCKNSLFGVGLNAVGAV
jgi:hypothetical protein